MNRLLRGILFGGTAALALIAGTAHARDVGHARPAPTQVTAPAASHVARPDRDRSHERTEHRRSTSIRGRLHHGRHAGRHAHHRSPRSHAAHRARLGRR